MIEEKKERELIIAVLEEVVEKADLWHHHKATLSVNASEKIELVVSRKSTTPKLTTRNEDKFFYGLPIGTTFTYSQSYDWEEVVLVAKKVGVKVEYNLLSSKEYRELGCFSGKVIGKEGKDK